MRQAYPSDYKASGAPGTWRHRLFVIIFEADTRAGRRFDLTLIGCILASVGVVMLDSVRDLEVDYGALFRVLEWLFTVVFTIEYGLRLYCVDRPRRYATSFFGIVDLISIVPSFLSLVFAGANYLLVVRIFRILRVFRILKLARFTGQAALLVRAVRASSHKITVFLIFIAALVTTFGCLVYLVEGRENGFTSIPKSIYWAIVTLTTVGYGDIYPHTDLGQLIAAIVMITGYAVIAVPTGIFTAELSQELKLQRATRPCPSCGKADHELSARFCSRCGARLAEEGTKASAD